MTSSNPAPTASIWWKSSYSTDHTDPACVETAYTSGGMAVRDTENRPLGHLEFTAGEWRAFLSGLEAL